MMHAGDIVRIKGQNVTEASMRIVHVGSDGRVATLRYLGGAAEFSEWTASLELVKCGHDTGRAWADFTPRDFDSAAKDQPLTLFGAPDECGSYATLFDAE